MERNISKKILNGITALSLLGGMAVSPIPTLAESALPYSDVSSGDYLYDGVKYCYDHGVLTGKNQTTFAPADSMTRAQLVTALHRYEGTPDALFASNFSDTVPGSYYEKAVDWAAEKGIINGYADGRFGPEDDLSREQLAKILKAYNDYKGYESKPDAALTDYPDGEDVSDYAKDGLAWAVGQGIVTGKSNGALDAHGKADRAQCATMLKRFLENKTTDNSTDQGTDSAIPEGSIPLRDLAVGVYKLNDNGDIVLNEINFWDPDDHSLMFNLGWKKKTLHFEINQKSNDRGFLTIKLIKDDRNYPETRKETFYSYMSVDVDLTDVYEVQIYIHNATECTLTNAYVA